MNARSRELGVPESLGCLPISEAQGILTPLGGAPRLYPRPSGWMLAAVEYNRVVGYRITTADDEVGVNLTDDEWRALVYVASNHGFSAPHLRLERVDEAVDIDGADVQKLRSALGKALEARDTEEIRTPDGELAYDTLQRVRHVLLANDVRLTRTRM